jgi:Family of unknown function (DUF6299)
MLRRAVLTLLVAAMVAVVAAPAALARPPRLRFAVDGARLTADPHTVVVSGTYRCPVLDLDVSGGSTIDLTVSQGEVNGFGGVTIEVCDGTTQTWQADVTTFGEPAFTTGRARVLASGLVFARDPAGQDVTLQVDLQQGIRIRG